MSWTLLLNVILAVYAFSAAAMIAFALMMWHDRFKARVAVDRLLVSAGYRRSLTPRLQCFAAAFAAALAGYAGLSAAAIIVYAPAQQLVLSSLFLFGAVFLMILYAIECVAQERPAMVGEEPALAPHEEHGF